MGTGLLLKTMLRDRNMTIKSLAEKTGISINTLYSITKRDSGNVDPVILQRIASALGVSTDDLISAKSADPAIDMADVDIAFYGAYSELSEDDQKTVRDMVALMRERRKDKK